MNIDPTGVNVPLFRGVYDGNATMTANGGHGIKRPFDITGWEMLIARSITRFLTDATIKSAKLHDYNYRACALTLAASQAAERAKQKYPRVRVPRIGVLSIAASLNRPYETTRRDIAELFALGCFNRADHGKFTIENTTHKKVAKQKALVLAVFCDLLKTLARNGFYARELAELTDNFSPGSNRERREILESAARDFLLRLIEGGMHLHGNSLERATLFCAVGGVNTESMLTHTDLATTYRTKMVSDPFRRPISARAMANLTGMPPETVRRHLNSLIRRGLCARLGRRGVIVPVRVYDKPEVAEITRLYLLLFVEALSRLTQLIRKPGVEKSADLRRRERIDSRRAPHVQAAPSRDRTTAKK